MTARGLSLRTADSRGEEFPVFRAFWIEKPALGDNTLVIHALLDSPSVTGAYRFTLRPGEATIIDTEMTLFPRVDLDHVGIAGLAGASLFTPLDRRRSDDIRPAAAEMNGLQMLTGKNEWVWRPLSNRNNLQLSSFVDANPKGFGFLTRDRDIGAYQDDVAHWEQRPSLWVEPLGEWGEGAVQLVEIPSESDFNQNIIAYWRPKQLLANGAEANFAYRQFWCWEPPARPPLRLRRRRARRSRGGAQTSPFSRRFHRRYSWRPRPCRDVEARADHLARIGENHRPLRQPAREDLPRFVRCRPRRGEVLRAAARPPIGRRPDQRNLAL